MTGKEQIEWFQMIIDDPEALPGSTILSVLQGILKICNFKYVILDAIQGAPISDWPFYQMIDRESEILKVNELLDVLPKIKQLDWGDFFLFKALPINWSNRHIHTLSIKLTPQFVRWMTNMFMSISPHEKIIKKLQNMNFVIESIKRDKPENLEFPE